MLGVKMMDRLCCFLWPWYHMGVKMSKRILACWIGYDQGQIRLDGNESKTSDQAGIVG